ncbi:ATP-dependent DNA helicase [Hespellia stercorisuis]|uniref:DNA 5'-3' helicase n=1 Tax=Hespellia stercorisuis DSM 15480 TaxID=1121950 RepID=A0A1M6PG96_9FIRM|nr:ATP-dependent DNA helicase [Hespellia stercorisuis]SHK06971.1 Rad3-related DNA helicase [Hespellia stercorisuis DSM 15480]
MDEKQLIKISVRNLVEFILREGDIDNRIAGGTDKDAMQLGSKIHRKIQRRMGADYHAEVALKLLIPYDVFDIQVEGRADGIITGDTVDTIDEIKGVLKELALIEKPVPVHLAQAKCYAYIYAKQNQKAEMKVQMTYCQMETEEIRQFVSQFTVGELEEWFLDVIHRYEKWARFQVEWKEKRNASIRQVEFPFSYREGQRELVTSVYKTMLRRKKLFIQAPTGVGKTMAAVFPAVKAVGEGLGEKIFYLTAKTITRTVAEQAFETLKEQNLRLKVITLTAKEKICFCEETDCSPESCPYAKGHYDRVNDAVFDMITSTDDMSRVSLEKQAEKYQVCPFEMALDVSLWVDAVICDYNYVFDPNAHLRRFFSEGGRGDYLFLIDEAHNLVERGREMYSASLYKEDIMEVRRLVKNEDAKLSKRLEECNKLLLALKRECETYQVQESVGHLILKLMNAMGEMERFLEEHQGEEVRQKVLDLYFEVRMFVTIHDCLDENYVIYTEMERNGHFKLKLFCVNPAVNLQQFLDQGNSTVFFSATLLPINYYRLLLSTDPDDYAIYAQSTFSQEQRLLLLGVDVSTKYTLRSPQMYEMYAQYILDAVRAKKGNYMAFFPSYLFMEEVCSRVLAQIQGNREMECIIQSQYMNEEARELFLETFEEERDNSLVGFCVMGGIFAEGIDLTEDRLIGAFIVGTGLPQVCNEREILKNYFDGKGMRGFDYAYLYPGMNKVLQSAGRVIRTEEDRGVILLLDERFRGRQYRSVFPREWETCDICNLGGVQKKLADFWNQEK